MNSKKISLVLILILIGIVFLAGCTNLGVTTTNCTDGFCPDGFSEQLSEKSVTTPIDSAPNELNNQTDTFVRARKTREIAPKDLSSIECNSNGLCEGTENHVNCNTDCVTPNTCNYDSVCDNTAGENLDNCIDCPSNIPTNKNALCVYNNNTEISRKICNYYANARPGVKLLGLDIPIEKFRDIGDQIPLVSENTISGFGRLNEAVPTIIGVNNNAFEFDGKQDYFQTNASVTGNHTISFWLKTSNKEMQALMGNDWQNFTGIFIIENKARPAGTLMYRDTWDSGNGQIMIANVFLTDNEWHHYTILNKDNMISAYRDAKLIGSSAMVKTIETIKVFTVGKATCYGCGETMFLNGALDEVNIFDSALNETEISSLSKNLGIESTPILHLPFDNVYLPQERSYEDMNVTDFDQFVKTPVYAYAQNFPEITHIALAKDIPIILFGRATPEQTLEGYRGAQGYLASNLDSTNEYYEKLIHFNPIEYDNLNFAVSYLTGYTWADIKTMIDKAVLPETNDATYIIDMDSESITLRLNTDKYLYFKSNDTYAHNGQEFQTIQFIGIGGVPMDYIGTMNSLDVKLTSKEIDITKPFVRIKPDGEEINNFTDEFYITDFWTNGWTIAEPTLNKTKENLVISNIKQNNILLDKSNYPKLKSDKDVIVYMGPGSYHSSYGEYKWITGQNFEFDTSNRAIMSSLESFNGLSFKDTPKTRLGGGQYQGRIAEAFMPTAFGGTNYSSSFAGAMGYVQEPGGMQNILVIWTTAYANGLTFAETAMSGIEHITYPFVHMRFGGRLIAVGDPLMRLQKKAGLLMPCKNNNDCETNFCTEDIEGNKKCSSRDYCAGQNSTYESNIDNYLVNYLTPTNTSTCIDLKNSKECKNGVWEESVACVKGAFCINSFGECKTDIVGTRCSTNEECIFGTSPLFCDEDYLGANRCKHDINGCIINSSGDEVTNNDFACITNNSRAQCIDGNWSSSIETCEYSCESGTCVPQESTTHTYNLEANKQYLLALPIKPLSPLLNNLFQNSNYPFVASAGTTISIFDYPIQTMFGRLGTVEFPSNPYFLGKWVDIRGSRNSISAQKIFPGDAIQITTKNTEEQFTFVGTTITQPIPISINREYEYFGVPYCYEEYDAEKVLTELQEIDSRCTKIGRFDVTLQDWVTYPQENFSIINTDGYYVQCASDTDFIWTPRCGAETPITCTTNNDCGEPHFVGTRSCDNKKVVQDKNIWTCENAGTTESTCVESTLREQVITNCAPIACISGACECTGDDCRTIRKRTDQSDLNILVNNTVFNNNYFRESARIKIQDGIVPIVEFDFGFTNDLNLEDTNFINGTTNGNDYLIIKDLNINTTKTVYIDRNEGNKVCILDEENPNLADLTSTCIRIACPGNKGDITCAIDGNYYKVTGLQHSGIIADYEYCGDDYCSPTESCSTCPDDCYCTPNNPPPTNPPITPGGGGTTPPPEITCENASDCGSPQYTGGNYCSSNKVVRKYETWSCTNAGTTNSACVKSETEKTITNCRANEECKNAMCTTTGTITCAQGFTQQGNTCVCLANKCGENCYTAQGVCCNGEYKIGETSCSTIVTDTNTNPFAINFATLGEYFNFENGELSTENIILIGGITGIIIIIIILLFVTLHFKKKPKQPKKENYDTYTEKDTLLEQLRENAR